MWNVSTGARNSQLINTRLHAPLIQKIISSGVWSKLIFTSESVKIWQRLNKNYILDNNSIREYFCALFNEIGEI